MGRPGRLRARGSNGQAEDDCKDDGTEDAGESCDAAVSPLKLALLLRLHATAHEALQGWPCKPDGGEDEDCGRECDLVVCEPSENRRRAPVLCHEHLEVERSTKVLKWSRKS